MSGEGLQGWISVRGWRRFQHYDPEKRQPPWIKNYTDLMGKDEYLSLNAGERSVLHGVWLEYASSQCSLRFDARLLGRRLNLRVTKQQLESLVRGGWIDVVASKTLAEGYHSASPRAHDVEVETEVETEPLRSPLVIAPVETVDNSVNGSRETKLEDMPL